MNTKIKQLSAVQIGFLNLVKEGRVKHDGVLEYPMIDGEYIGKLRRTMRSLLFRGIITVEGHHSGPDEYGYLICCEENIIIAKPVFK